MPGRRRPSRKYPLIQHLFLFHADSLTLSWANQICADDDQERAIVLASMKSVCLAHAGIPVTVSLMPGAVVCGITS